MGIFSNILNNIIKDKSNALNSINEDIAKLEEQKKKAERAASLFQDCYDRTNTMISETQICFNGEAAAAFIDKLTRLSKYCNSRITEMNNLSANLSKRLSELEKQKKKSEEALEKIREVCERFSWVWI